MTATPRLDPTPPTPPGPSSIHPAPGESEAGRFGLLGPFGATLVVGHHVQGDPMTADALRATCGAVPGASWASVTVVRDGSGATATASDPTAQALDDLQYEAADGPCLAAIGEDDVVASRFDREPRWPGFVAGALRATPGRAAVSVPLARLGYADTSLNLYSADADAFGPDSRADVLTVAAEFALVMTVGAHRQRADNLQVALVSNRRVGAAMGILMHRYRLTHDAAFQALRMASQNANRKLRDVAEDVLLVGDLPEGALVPRRPGRPGPAAR